MPANITMFSSHHTSNMHITQNIVTAIICEFSVQNTSRASMVEQNRSIHCELLRYDTAVLHACLLDIQLCQVQVSCSQVRFHTV